MFNENRMIRQKRYVSGGGVYHSLNKWINGELVDVMPQKVGGTIRYYPLPHKPFDMANRGTVSDNWGVPLKKSLEAEPFSQPSGYNRNVVLSAINSSMGSGVSNRPRKIVRRLM